MIQDTVNSAGWGVAVDVSANDVKQAAKSVYVGVTGDLEVRLQQHKIGESIIIKNAAVGYHPLNVVEFISAGTTASELIALK